MQVCNLVCFERQLATATGAPWASAGDPWSPFSKKHCWAHDPPSPCPEQPTKNPWTTHHDRRLWSVSWRSLIVPSKRPCWALLVFARARLARGPQESVGQCRHGASLGHDFGAGLLVLLRTPRETKACSQSSPPLPHNCYLTDSRQ